MYKSFKIRNFRCFKDFTIENFGKINLIAGANNSGKTVFLEALFVNCGIYNPTLILAINAFRGLMESEILLSTWGQSPWDNIFRDYDTSQIIQIDGNFSDNTSSIIKLRELHDPIELAEAGSILMKGNKFQSPLTSQITKVLEFEYSFKNQKTQKTYIILGDKGPLFQIPTSPPFPAYFQTSKVRLPYEEENTLFSNISKIKQKKTILDIIKIIEPRIYDIEILAECGKPILHGFYENYSHPIPISLMGESVRRLLNIILQIMNARNGVVLIDEFENGIYFSKLFDIWKAIGKLVEETNVQIFATTHSFECIESAYTALSSNDNFHFYRFDYNNELNFVESYDLETLKSALEMGFEIR